MSSSSARPLQKLLSGFIRLHVLHHAAKEEICGNWMLEELRRHGYTPSPGTLYPMLRGLEKDGWLQSRPEGESSRRRMYRATASGKRALKQARMKLHELFKEVGQEK